MDTFFSFNHSQHDEICGVFLTLLINLRCLRSRKFMTNAFWLIGGSSPINEPTAFLECIALWTLFRQISWHALSFNMVIKRHFLQIFINILLILTLHIFFVIITPNLCNLEFNNYIKLLGNNNSKIGVNIWGKCLEPSSQI